MLAVVTFVVDSCLEPEGRHSTALAYLRELGLDPARAVKLVVITHWHDDHVGGMADVARSCRRARIAMSQSFTSADFIAGVHLIEPASMIPRSGVREFWEIWKIVEEGRQPTFASVDKLLWERRDEPCVRAVGLSPSAEDVTRGLRQLREAVLDRVSSEPLEYVPPLDPNESSVVLWISVGGDTHLLLGADLARPASSERGWLAILESASEWRDKQAEVFKIPHHGSANAYEPRVWSEMLVQDAPIGLVAPFIQGGVRLPTAEQRSRLLSHSSETYISSEATVSPQLSDAALQTLRETTSECTFLETPSGQVRLRKRLGSTTWAVTTFPPADRLAA